MVKALYSQFFMIVMESYLSMSTLGQHVSSACPWMHHAAQLMVHGNRIVRDMFVSAFIFVTMLSAFVFNALNDRFVPSFNFHQALIYRTPGPMSKTHAEGDDIDSDDAWESEASSDDLLV